MKTTLGNTRPLFAKSLLDAHEALLRKTTLTAPSGVASFWSKRMTVR